MFEEKNTATEEVMPKHIGYAQQTVLELINNFSAREQYEFLSFIKDTINEHYNNRIIDIESELKRFHVHREEFNGSGLINKDFRQQ